MVVGMAISVANFHLISRNIEKINFRFSKTSKRFFILYFFKLILLGLLFYLVLKTGYIHPLGLFLGLLFLPLIAWIKNKGRQNDYTAGSRRI